MPQRGVSRKESTKDRGAFLCLLNCSMRFLSVMDGHGSAEAGAQESHQPLQPGFGIEGKGEIREALRILRPAAQTLSKGADGQIQAPKQFRLRQVRQRGAQGCAKPLENIAELRGENTRQQI